MEAALEALKRATVIRTRAIDSVLQYNMPFADKLNVLHKKTYTELL